MTHLTSLRLSGWKSIRDAEIDLRPLNVLIGANGAGKSNLVSLIKLMNEMMEGRFQECVGRNGGAESLLHYGSKRTEFIEARFRFAAENEIKSYYFRLLPIAGNSLLFATEQMGPADWDIKESFYPPLGQGHLETRLREVDLKFSP